MTGCVLLNARGVGLVTKHVFGLLFAPRVLHLVFGYVVFRFSTYQLALGGMSHPALSGLVLVALYIGLGACAFGLAHLPEIFWCGAAAALSVCVGSMVPLPQHFKRPPRVVRNARGRVRAGQGAGKRAELAVTAAAFLSLGAGVAACFLCRMVWNSPGNVGNLCGAVHARIGTFLNETKSGSRAAPSLRLTCVLYPGVGLGANPVDRGCWAVRLFVFLGCCCQRRTAARTFLLWRSGLPVRARSTGKISGKSHLW